MWLLSSLNKAIATHGSSIRKNLVWTVPSHFKRSSIFNFGPQYTLENLGSFAGNSPFMNVNIEFKLAFYYTMSNLILWMFRKLIESVDHSKLNHSINSMHVALCEQSYSLPLGTSCTIYVAFKIIVLICFTWY